MEDDAGGTPLPAPSLGSAAAEVAAGIDEDGAETALPKSDEFSLAREFYDAYKAYFTFIKKEEKRPEQSDLDDLSTKLKAVAFYVTRLRLFSPNEDLDDVSTDSLKFLLIPFLLGEVANATRDMDARLGSVRRAVVYWRAFLHDCERLGLAHSDDMRAIERDSERRIEQNALREEKISRFRRGKELDEKAEYFFAKKKEALGDSLRWGSGPDFDEDLEREFVISLIQRAASSATENVLMTMEEIPMLEMMMARGGPGKGPRTEKAPPVEKPFIVRIQDKAELMRLYKEMVFQNPHAQPTMSIEEAAEIEMEQAQEDQYRKKAAEASRHYEERERWYGGDRYGSKEDDDEEREIHKKRDWDNWKDEHPWGSGNKMANVS